MALFGGSKSTSEITSVTTNTDKRIATGEGGFVFQTDGANSTINFEDLNQETVNQSLALAADYIEKATTIFDKAFLNTSQSLQATQSLAQGLLVEKNTPSSDNMRNIVYAVMAGISILGISLIWRGK